MIMIKKVDGYEIEFSLANCDTCKVFINGFLDGRYDITTDTFTPCEDEWFKSVFETLTERQKRLVIKYANKFMIANYEDVYKGHEDSKYFIEQVNKCKRNIA